MRTFMLWVVLIALLVVGVLFMPGCQGTVTGAGVSVTLPTPHGEFKYESNKDIVLEGLEYDPATKVIKIAKLSSLGSVLGGQQLQLGTTQSNNGTQLGMAFINGAWQAVPLFVQAPVATKPEK